MKWLFICTLFIFHTYNKLYADHIGGGTLYYEIIDSTEDSILVTINFEYFKFLSCNSVGEDEAIEIIHVRAGNFLSIVHAPLVLSEPVANPEFPCLETPLDFCIKKLTYSDTIQLEILNESYHAILMDCCRSDDLTNVETTLIPPGSIYQIEISPFSQSTGNSSPVSNSPIPNFVCIGEPFSVDFAAYDAQVDQLVYELCAPYSFPGNMLQSPNPLPPYDPPAYIFPPYNYYNPLGDNNLSLNPTTGQLNLTPTQIGQYLVGVCVSEYRNGQLVGTMLRDFVLNIVDCPLKVFAALEADTILANGDYLFKVCNDASLILENGSGNMDYITNYFWEIEGETITTWNSTLYFDTSGTYQAKLFLNPGEECSDTANIIIKVSKDIAADFDFSYDTCVAGPVHFINQSYAEDVGIKETIWDFNNGHLSTASSPLYQFLDPGEQTVKLTIEDFYACKDSIIKSFDWQPAPVILIVAPSEKEGCSPLAVSFENHSTPIDSTYEIFWDFSNGENSEAFIPQTIYDTTGSYPVYLSITSPIGCFVDSTFQDLVLVEPPPVADFNYEPNPIFSITPEVAFNDASLRAVDWHWQFDSLGTDYIQNPIYAFEDPGLYKIQLVVEDKYFCADTITKTLEVLPFSSYFLPNAFSPNGDGANELFKGAGYVDGITNFEMSIWNRWGKQVFYTTDILGGWNGQIMGILKQPVLLIR